MIEIHSTQLPPEITLLEIIGGFGSNPILFTPATAKDMIQRHAPSEVETFETILNNLRSWTISRTYSSNTGI
jgi:hypothetical protein